MAPFEISPAVLHALICLVLYFYLSDAIREGPYENTPGFSAPEIRTYRSVERGARRPAAGRTAF